MSNQSEQAKNMEVEIALERQEIATRFQLLPTFATVPDLDVTLPTLPDVGRLLKFKTAATESGSGGRHLEFR
jgi:hypothetical protein